MAPPPSGSAPQAPPVYKGDVPNEDVHENSSGQAPPQAAAPPVARMDEVSGYENVGFEAGELCCGPRLSSSFLSLYTASNEKLDESLGPRLVLFVLK